MDARLRDGGRLLRLCIGEQEHDRAHQQDKKRQAFGKAAVDARAQLTLRGERLLALLFAAGGRLLRGQGAHGAQREKADRAAAGGAERQRYGGDEQQRPAQRLHEQRGKGGEQSRRREGEDDSLDSWRESHIAFLTEEGRQLGYEFSEDMPVIFEEFKLVYKGRTE